MFTISEKEERIYSKIRQMQKEGSDAEKSLAFDLIGVLGNESLPVSLDERLDYVEDKLREFYTKG